jgi:hypothetical protein
MPLKLSPLSTSVEEGLTLLPICVMLRKMRPVRLPVTGERRARFLDHADFERTKFGVAS